MITVKDWESINIRKGGGEKVQRVGRQKNGCEGGDDGWKGQVGQFRNHYSVCAGPRRFFGWFLGRGGGGGLGDSTLDQLSSLSYTLKNVFFVNPACT